MRVWIVLMMALALGGCSGAQIINAVTTDSGYAFKRDIRYSGNLSLDVYQPAGADHAPVVVFSTVVAGRTARPCRSPPTNSSGRP